jgi:nitrite reductase/ring-hydroxylating ferredoxin subunit
MADGSGRKSDETGEARRDFLRAAAAVAAGAALAPLLAAGCGGAKIPDSLFAAGRIGEFSMSAAPRKVINTSIYVLHNEQGYAAISGKCTHEGCAVDAVGSGGFSCPCHGSRFAADGTVTDGPAGRDLSWFEVLLVDGELQIDPTVEVAKGTFVTG